MQADAERDYVRAAEWAEHRMTLPANSRMALRGQDAADFGCGTVARATGVPAKAMERNLGGLRDCGALPVTDGR